MLTTSFPRNTIAELSMQCHTPDLIGGMVAMPRGLVATLFGGMVTIVVGFADALIGGVVVHVRRGGANGNIFGAIGATRALLLLQRPMVLNAGNQFLRNRGLL